MIVDLFVRAIVVCFAYFVAVLGAAGFFVVAVVGLDGISQSPGEPSWEFAVRLAFYTGAVASVAGAIATLPILVAAAVAEALRLRGFVFHLALGAIFGALAVLAWDGGEARASQPEYVIGMASGAIGAFFYWLLAGRNAGRWRDRASSVAPPEAESRTRP